MDSLPDPQTITPDQERTVVDFIKDRYEAARGFDRPFKDAAMDDLRYLNSLLPEGWPHYWGFFYPETAGTSRDVMEQVMGSFFDQEEVFGVRGEDGQEELRGELQRERLKYVLREADYKLKTYLTLQEAVHFGNGWVYTGVRPRRRQVSQQQATPWGMQSLTVDQVELLPYLHPISRFDSYPCEHGELEDEMPYLIWREWLPLQLLAARARWGRWQHAEEAKGSILIDRREGAASVGGDDVWEDVYGRFREMGYAVGEGNSSSRGGGMHFIELWHYYEAGDNGDGFGRFAIIGDRKHLFKVGDATDREEKPIAGVKYAPLPIGGSSWQGIGVPACIRTYQDEINVRSAQEADAIEYFLKPQRIYGPTAGIKSPGQLLPWPGQVIPTEGDVNQIKMLEMPHVPPALGYNRDRAQIGIQRISKVNDISRGLGSTQGLAKGSETASGMQLLTNLSQRSATFQMLYFEEKGIVRQLNQLSRLSQATMVGEQVLDVTENPRLKEAGFEGQVLLRPDDVAGHWRVYLVASTRAVQNPEQAQLVAQFLDWLSSKPGMLERIDWMKAAEMIGPMAVRRGLQNLFKPEEQVAAEQQQALLQALAMHQLQAQLAPAGAAPAGSKGPR